jgi:hypothetical protein
MLFPKFTFLTLLCYRTAAACTRKVEAYARYTNAAHFTARRVLKLDALMQRLFAFCWHHFTATVKTVRAHVMTQMYFTSRWLNRQRWVSQKVVGAVHTTLGRCLFVLLNCHLNTPKSNRHTSENEVKGQL